MKSLWIVFCIILSLNCELMKCNPQRETVNTLSNYPSEKSFVCSLNKAVIVVLDSSKEENSMVYTYRHDQHGPTIKDVNFKGHVNDFILQPQKQLGIFTELAMRRIVILHDDDKAIKHEFALDFVPSKVSFPENNNKGQFFIIFDKVERKLYFTQSGGRKFQFLTDNVESLDWQYEKGKNYLLIERRYSDDPSSSLEYVELTPIFINIPKLATLADQVQDYAVNGDFIVVHRANNTLLFHKRQPFIRTVFYPLYRVHKIHFVDTENNTIKIIAENDQESRFYIGNYFTNSRVIRFELSLMNIEMDYLTKINSAHGVYIATQNNAATSVITYDNGRTWNDIEINVANNKLFSSKRVPGVIAGTIGRHLMVSKDAGKSWYKASDQYYYYVIDKILGIIVGTDLDATTTTLIYSTTFGRSWSPPYHIYDTPLKNHAVYSKDDSAEFYIVAHDTKHNNFLTRINFMLEFTKPCSELHYNKFTTDVCVLGQKMTYKRRNRSCYPDQLIHIDKCDCSFDDYDCDSNFVRINLTQACIQDPVIKTIASPNCHPGDLYSKIEGYQKIESSVCMETSKVSDVANMEICPYTKVEYLLAKSRNNLILYEENNRQFKSLNYVDYNARESYEFDLLNARMFEINRTQVKLHSINDNAHGQILIHESEKIRNLNYDWVSGWLFYILKSPLRILAFPADSTNMKRIKLLIHGNAISDITGLTIHVVQKYMYWRDGNNFKYAILNYSEDNTDIEVTNVQIILEDESIDSDLVIDYITDRLYFYNPQRGGIRNCNLFGLECRTTTTLSEHLDYSDPTPRHIYLIAISHLYIYFYNPFKKTVQYWDRSKDITHSESNEQELFEHDIPDVTEMKFISKTIQLYTRCRFMHSDSPMCSNILNATNVTSEIVETPILTEMMCPYSKYCDGVFDCFYGEDEAYCGEGSNEVVEVRQHKIYWIGLVIALGVISFFVASAVLYKKARTRVPQGVRYNVVENRVLIQEDLLEDDESDIEMLFN